MDGRGRGPLIFDDSSIRTYDINSVFEQRKLNPIYFYPSVKFFHAFIIYNLQIPQ
jgi:hypothetical protein